MIGCKQNHLLPKIWNVAHTSYLKTCESTDFTFNTFNEILYIFYKEVFHLHLNYYHNQLCLVITLSRTLTCPLTGSSCWRVARTNTAVLPIPDFAWHTTSIPRIACGMHSCWTGKKIMHILHQQYLNCYKYIQTLCRQPLDNKLERCQSWKSNFSHSFKNVLCCIHTLIKCLY